MLISILIPTRNRLRYLESSLASAMAQEGVDIEVIVSDDGSDDGTVEFVRTLAASDPRVRLVTDNPNPGIFENVEHLIAAATGDAFTILGDDDLLDPDFCRRLAEPMQADPSVVLTFCDHRTIDGKGDLMKRVTREISRAYGRDTLPDGPVAEPEIVALRGGIWLGFALYRRSVFGTERFDRSCETAADWDFAIRASPARSAELCLRRCSAPIEIIVIALTARPSNRSSLAIGCSRARDAGLGPARSVRGCSGSSQAERVSDGCAGPGSGATIPAPVFRAGGRSLVAADRPRPGDAGAASSCRWMDAHRRLIHRRRRPQAQTSRPAPVSHSPAARSVSDDAVVGRHGPGRTGRPASPPCRRGRVGLWRAARGSPRYRASYRRHVRCRPSRGARPDAPPTGSAREGVAS
jgi:hypothetical protein